MSKEITNTAIAAAVVASIYTALMLLFGTYNLVSVWPSNSTELVSNATQTVILRGTNISFSLGPETLVMLVIIIVGAVGACVFSLWSIAKHVARKDFTARWFVWYLLRPFTGAGLALLFYFLVRGGLLTIGSNLQNLNLIVIAGISALVGMFSEQALQKLRELADSTFGASSGGGTAKTAGSKEAK